eukprot:scaffold197160_cov22-Prasinocladus_malaysianus.AAC.1
MVYALMFAGTASSLLSNSDILIKAASIIYYQLKRTRSIYGPMSPKLSGVKQSSSKCALRSAVPSTMYSRPRGRTHCRAHKSKAARINQDCAYLLKVEQISGSFLQQFICWLAGWLLCREPA